MAAPSHVLPATSAERLARLPSARLARPKALVFDLDGTLVDTMSLLADLATDLMAEAYGLPRSLARELYLATCGLPFVRQLELLFPGDARNPGTVEAFEGEKPRLCGRVRMAAETVDALEALRAQGLRLVVSSNNGVENVEAFARDAAFRFELTLGFGGGLAKGAPHFDHISEALGVTRGEMLFVGDSLHDGDLAAAEGVPFLAVAGTFSRERFRLRFPDVLVVDRVAELAGLF